MTLTSARPRDPFIGGFFDDAGLDFETRGVLGHAVYGAAEPGEVLAALDASGRESRALTVNWEGYKDLGIWSKPTGAPFLCIEPWYSMASPAGWQGEIAEKPGILTLAPGESRDFVWRVTL